MVGRKSVHVPAADTVRDPEGALTQEVCILALVRLLANRRGALNQNELSVLIVVAFRALLFVVLVKERDLAEGMLALVLKDFFWFRDSFFDCWRFFLGNIGLRAVDNIVDVFIVKIVHHLCPVVLP